MPLYELLVGHPDGIELLLNEVTLWCYLNEAVLFQTTALFVRRA
jgi:hypothetical protein